MLPECATVKQRQMFEFALAHNYNILAADPRTGKSMVAIALRKERACNCLIVCPAHLVPNWKKEIKQWDSNSSVTTFTEGKKLYDVCDSDFVVISYDLVQKADYLFEWADFLVGDEIHHVAHMNSLKSKFLHKNLYENSLPYFIGLTGTPLKNRVKEFYSLIALTNYDPLQTDHSFLDTFPDEITFAEKFSHAKSYQVEVKNGRRITVTNYHGLRNVKELKTWLKDKYIRIRADKSDFPPVSFLPVLVSDIDDKELLRSFNSYFVPDKNVRKNFSEKYKGYKVTNSKKYKGLKISKSQRYQEIRDNRTSAVLPEHKRNAALKTVPFTIKYVENLLQTAECCLIYSDHRPSCHLLAKHFGVPAITGEMPGKRRFQLVNDFQNGKINRLCATIGALKEGSDLFRTKDIVLNDLPWVVGDLDQVCARAQKIGKIDPITIHVINGSPQSHTIFETLNEKRDTINRAT